MDSHRTDNTGRVNPKRGNAQDIPKIGDIVEKIPWDKVTEEAGKQLVAVTKSMAATYVVEKGIEDGKILAKYAKEECKVLIEDGKEFVKDFKGLISPKAPTGKHPRSRKLKESEDRDQRRKILRPPDRDRELVRRPSHPPPRRAPPPHGTAAPDSPLEGGGRSRPPAPRISYPTANGGLQRAPRPGNPNPPSNVYEDWSPRSRPTQIQKQSTQVPNPSALPVAEIYESLDINPTILDQHVREAESAKTRLANEESHERVCFLSRLPRFKNWIGSNKSGILIVNGNDATYNHDQPFSIFSYYLNTIGKWFNDTIGARPLRGFAGAYDDFDNTVNKAHTLMRSLCWQILDQYPIEMRQTKSIRWQVRQHYRTAQQSPAILAL